MEKLRMLARLNDETQHLHAEADSDVDRYLFGAQVTSEQYRTYLGRCYGFLVPLEAALARAPGLEDTIAVGARAKAALVVHDLLALGMSMTEINELPQCQAIPSFRGPAAALGWMYVVERPLLSSAVVRGHLATKLRAEMVYAASYLSCYEGAVGARWRELGEAMERVAFSPMLADRIVSAAHEAFGAMIRFRAHRAVRPAAIRFAG